MASFGLGMAAAVFIIAWTWAVIDIARHDRVPRNYKIFWILLCLVLPLVGTVIWLGLRPPKQGDPSSGYFSDETLKRDL